MQLSFGGSLGELPRWFSSGDFPNNFPRWSPPVISPGDFPPVISSDLESLLERMKRLDFSKPVTRRLTRWSNDYTNPNTNLTRGRP